MAQPSYLKDCLSRKVLFFSGKGGVGKSTVTWATAQLCRRKGLKVTVAHWNPFESDDKIPSPHLKGIEVLTLDTMACFREYALKILKFEKVYDVVFENRVLKTFLKAAPGLSDTVIAGKIWNLYDKEEQDLLIVDLPSSGHAISFFQSPLGIKKIFSAGFVQKEAEKIASFFRSTDMRIDLVTLPEELPIVESMELKRKLQAVCSFHFGFLHLNQCLPNFQLPDCKSLLGPVQEVCEGYRVGKQNEKQALEMAAQLEMPILSLPALTFKENVDLIEQMADYLESA